MKTKTIVAVLLTLAVCLFSLEIWRHAGSGEDTGDTRPRADAGLTDSDHPGVPGESTSVSPALRTQPSDIARRRSNTQAEAAEFVKALCVASDQGQPEVVEALVQNVPRTPACSEELQRVITDPSSSMQLKRSSAVALLRMGVKENTEFILDQSLAASMGGNSKLSAALASALATELSPASAEAMFDFLLGSGHFSGSPASTVPDEVTTTVRKVLREAADATAVGTLAASLYMDAASTHNHNALKELAEGVRSPVMFALLAVDAYRGGSTEGANSFLDPIGHGSDQHALQALMLAASQEPGLAPMVTDRVYNWVQQNQQSVAPSWLSQYLADRSQPAGVRVAAAYGYVALGNADVANRALQKALRGEQDPEVYLPLRNLLTAIAESGNQQ